MLRKSQYLLVSCLALANAGLINFGAIESALIGLLDHQTPSHVTTSRSSTSSISPIITGKSSQTTRSLVSTTGPIPATRTSNQDGNDIVSAIGSIESEVASIFSAIGKGLNTQLYTATSKWAHPTPSASANSKGKYTSWNSFKANGVNLAGWFEIESRNNPEIFALVPDAIDEWTWCEGLGENCGPTLEHHYATHYTTADIDKLASVGVNFLRIPMTYAAWVVVPGSQLYHGNQAKHLQDLTSYAISKYNMRVAIGLHSLPGGVNDLDIGEAIGHDDWFYNETNLAYSYIAVENILTWIEKSGNPWAFSIEVINEASDNLSGFATAAGVTANGTAWIVKYVKGVLARVEAINKSIPIVLQDCFLGEEHWSPYFSNTSNLVIDTHIYYFAAAGIYSEYVTPAICGQASAAGGDGKFPVYVGEWSLQVLYNNTFADRQAIFNTQRYAWEKYVSGGCFWSAKFNGTNAVAGEGTQRDYWYYEGLIDAGVIASPIEGATYC